MFYYAIALVAIILVTWSIVALRMRRRALVSLLAVSCFIPFGLPSAPLPLSAGATIVCAPATLSRWQTGLRSVLIKLLLVMIGLQTLSLLWSPDILRGVREITALASFLVSILCAFELIHHERQDPVVLICKTLWPFLTLAALSTVLFRVSPALERSYLGSKIAYVLLGNAARNIFTSEPNNVVASFKAGGLFFVNGNLASLVLGLYMLGCFVAWKRERRFRWLLLVAILLTGCLATGSKTGLVLLLVIPLLTMLVYRLSDGKSHAPLLSSLLVLIPAALWFVVQALYVVSSEQVDTQAGLADDPAEMASVRFVIWQPAQTLFQRFPVEGLGFGGWQEQFVKFVHLGTKGGAYPPHNLFIASWANAGVLNAIATAAFSIGVVYMAIQRARSARASSDRWSASVAAGGMVWVLVHGQGDNTSVFGAVASIPVTAAFVAWCLHQKLSDDNPNHLPAAQLRAPAELVSGQ